MALPLGPILLMTVVGAAVFGGLDTRKKKKNGVQPPVNGIQPDDEMLLTVSCAHIVDTKADGSMVSTDGGPWVDINALVVDPTYMAIQSNKPVVTFVVCEPDPIALQAIDQLCVQQPQIEFYGVYIHRIPAGAVKQHAEGMCVEQNALVAFAVNIPLGGGRARTYSSDDIPELLLHPGGNIANVFANVLAAAAGTEDPRSTIWTLEELGG
jgi:hypothetical protein